MSADWNAIRNEYVTTQISLRDLAQKHSVSFATLRRRSEKEKWVDRRKGHEHEVSTKVTQKVAEVAACAQADRLNALMNYTQQSADLLGVRLAQMAQSGKVKTYEVKAITEALKNIRELYRTDELSADDDPLIKYMEGMRNA